MRNRISGVLVALTIGVAGAALTATPAHATGDHLPSFDHRCDGTVVKVVPGKGESPLRIKVDGVVKWESDGPLMAQAEVDVPAGKVAVEVKAGKDWKPVGNDEWKDPGNCKPLDVDVELPTCKCLDLIVIVKNVNEKAVWVKANGGGHTILGSGDSKVYKSRADIKVYVAVKPGVFKLVKAVEYKAPECSSPSPSPSASPSPSPSPSASPSPSTSPSPTAGPAGTPSFSPQAPVPSLKPVGNNTPDEPRLPTTGFNAALTVGIGLVLAVLGGFLFLRFRRKPQQFRA